MPLEQADLDKIAEMIKTNNESLDVGAQIAAGFKGLNVAGAIKAAVEGEFGERDTAAEEAAAKAKKEKEEAGDGAQNIDPRVAKELADMRTKLATERKRSDDAEAARKTQALVAAGRSALGKAGVQSNRIEHAMALIHSAEGRLRTDSDGHPVVYFRRTGPAGDFDDEVGLTAGITEWLKTDDGKAFLPAVAGGGTGGGAGKKKGGGSNQAVTTQDQLAGSLLNGIFSR